MDESWCQKAWAELTEHERVFLLALLEHRGTFLRETDCGRFELEWGVPEWNIVTHSLMKREFVQKVNRMTQAIPMPVRHWGYQLTLAGRELMAWQNRSGETAPLAVTQGFDTDALTCLRTFRTWERDLADATKQAARDGEPLGVVMVDLDHFKPINDTHGHPKGNDVLREFARRLSAVIARKGTAYRYGGEEISLLLPNHSLQESLAVAERARRAIEATPCAGIAVTVSVGVAILPEHGADAEAIIANADKAMYDAKERGRNLVRYFGEPEPAAASNAAREPERRQPEPGGWSGEQLRRIRSDYLQNHVARCPTDASILSMTDMSTLSDRVARFIATCPGCGTSADI